MAIRDDFEVVAGQVRAVVQRFALGLLVVAAFGAMLIGKADTVLVEHARVLALDVASPVLEAIARPVAWANRAVADLREESAREVASRVEAETGYKSVSWQEAHEDLLSAFQIRNIIMYMVVGAILLASVLLSLGLSRAGRPQE